MIWMELKQSLRNPVFYITALIYIITFTLASLFQTGTEHSNLFQMNYALSIELLIVPLFILSIGSMTVAHHNETGWLKLLKTYPMRYRNYIFGHYITIVLLYTMMLTISIVIGIIIGVHIEIVFILLSFIMILIFSSIAVWVGIISRNRLSAIGIALCLWTLWLLIIPFTIIALNDQLNRQMLYQTLVANIHLNPVDLIRMLYYYWTDQLALLGPGFYNYSNWLKGIGHYILYINIMLFIGVPIVLSYITMLKVRKSK